MIFSKSFGYAVRGILFIAVMQDQKRYVQVEEIAATLNIPRHFMGKILKRLAKEDVLVSIKGPSGGFTVSPDTLQMSLLQILSITDTIDAPGRCVLGIKTCTPENPCPLHNKIEGIRQSLYQMLGETTLKELIKGDKTTFIQSIATGREKEKIPEN